MTQNFSPYLKYRDPEELGRILLRLERRGRLSVAQAAKFWHIHPQTAHKHIEWGWVQAVRIGQRLFILKDELDRHLVNGSYVGNLDAERPACG